MSIRVSSPAARTGRGVFALSLVVVIAAVLTGLALGHSFTAAPPVKQAKTATSDRTVLQDSNDWLSERAWQRRRAKKLRNRAYGGGTPFNPFSAGFGAPYSPWQSGGTYRTVCVRLCDGYYFPISFSTTRGRLAGDEQACRSRCTSDARLFYYPTGGGSPETMVDLRGRAYKDLATAFVYRTRYDKSCQCRPDPWSDEARERHAMYATEGWKRRARRVARLQQRRPRRASDSQLYPPVLGAPHGPGDQPFPSESRRHQSTYGYAPTTIWPGETYTPPRMGLGSRSRAIAKRRQRQRARRRARSNWRSQFFGRDD